MARLLQAGLQRERKPAENHAAMTVIDLETRRAKLGGSTIAAAAGIDPYCSPIRLWLEMTGRLTRDESEPMQLGKRLEPVIFDLLNERGYPCQRTPGLEAVDETRPWLIGHPDGVGVVALDGAVIEAKATGRATDAPPVAHVAQVQTYMHLMNADVAVVAQLGGLQLQVWDVERDERAIDALLHLGEAFMDYVRADRQPPPHGHPDDRHALGLAHPDAQDRRVRETREIRDVRRELHLLLEREKVWKERVESLRAEITAYMGDADTLVDSHDNVVATWHNVTSRRMDTKAIRANLPTIADEYTTETTTRRLDLK